MRCAALRLCLVLSGRSWHREKGMRGREQRREPGTRSQAMRGKNNKSIVAKPGAKVCVEGRKSIINKSPSIMMNFARRAGQVQVDPDPHPAWDQGVVLQVCVWCTAVPRPCATWVRIAACFCPKKAPSWSLETVDAYTCGDGTGAGAYNNDQVPWSMVYNVPWSPKLHHREAGRQAGRQVGTCPRGFLPRCSPARQARNQHYACGRGPPSLTDTAGILACHLIRRPPSVG